MLTACHDEQEKAGIEVSKCLLDSGQTGVQGDIVYQQNSDAFVAEDGKDGSREMADLLAEAEKINAKLLEIFKARPDILGPEYSNALIDLAQRNGRPDTLLSFAHFPSEGKAQKTGDVSFKLAQKFEMKVVEQHATPFIVHNFGDASLLTSFTPKIRIQAGISNRLQREATIAHELGHLYFDHLFPGLMHDDEVTVEGLNRGKALSEGFALFVEKLYLRAQYEGKGLAMFEAFHPVSDKSSPYGRYDHYFWSVCTNRASVDPLGRSEDGIPLRVFTPYLSTVSMQVVGDRVIATAKDLENGALKDRITNNNLQCYNLNNTPSRSTDGAYYCVGGVLRTQHSVVLSDMGGSTIQSHSNIEQYKESLIRKLRDLEPYALQASKRVLSDNGMARVNGFLNESILFSGDAPSVEITIVNSGLSVNLTCKNYFLKRGRLSDTKTETLWSLGNDVQHLRTNISKADLRIPQPVARDVCSDIGKSAGAAYTLPERVSGRLEEVIQETDLVAAESAIFFCRNFPDFFTNQCTAGLLAWVRGAEANYLMMRYELPADMAAALIRAKYEVLLARSTNNAWKAICNLGLEPIPLVSASQSDFYKSFWPLVNPAESDPAKKEPVSIAPYLTR